MHLCLPSNMEKYRTLLENQYTLAKIYNENKNAYILSKNREEKRRYKANQKLLKSKAIIDAKSNC